jgi:hypothetical protein
MDAERWVAHPMISGATRAAQTPARSPKGILLMEVRLLDKDVVPLNY